MTVKLLSKQHHVDCDEPDDSGLHDYYYAYWDYELKSGNWRFKIRSYDDDRGKVIIRSYSRKGEQSHLFDQVPYNDQEFCDAIKYLVENEGATRIELLSSEKLIVDLSRLRATS